MNSNLLMILFSILAVTTCKPKLWIPCEWSSANDGRPDDAELAFPCKVDIESEPCKVTLSDTIIKVRASMELAVIMASTASCSAI